MYVYGEKVIHLLFAISKGSEHFSIVFTACRKTVAKCARGNNKKNAGKVCLPLKRDDKLHLKTFLAIHGMRHILWHDQRLPFLPIP